MAPGQADKPVAWFKTEDGKAYTVIFGDLSDKVVPADELDGVVGAKGD